MGFGFKIMWICGNRVLHPIKKAEPCLGSAF
jgi:hypothetical protein